MMKLCRFLTCSWAQISITWLVNSFHLYSLRRNFILADILELWPHLLIQSFAMVTAMGKSTV